MSHKWPSLACFLTILLFAWWSNPHLIGFIEKDTQSYLDVAQNFLDSSAQDRPIGYPLLIETCIHISSHMWTSVVVLIQYTSLAIISCLLLNLFCTYNVSTVVALPASIIIGICPDLISAANYILPELILPAFITLAWFTVLHMDALQDKRRVFIRAGLVGLFSGMAVLIKPVWLLGIIPLSAGFLLANLKEYRKALGPIAIMILAHVAIWWAWQGFLVVRFHQFVPSRIATVNLNLAAIREGLTKNASDTPLYNYLKGRGLLERSVKLTWKDYDKFTEIKNQIPWSERLDSSFYKKALSNNKLQFAKDQLSRWPRFFINRPRGIDSDHAFPFMPRWLKFLYFGSYNWLYRHLLPLLLSVSLITGLYYRKLRLLTLTSFFIIMYLSITLALLTYQDPHFTRMRVAVEPVMLFMTFLPVCLGIDYLLKKLRQY